MDFDNLERYVLIGHTVVYHQLATLDDITLEKSQYVVGQVFYAYTDEVFYILTLTATGTTSLVVTNDYQVRIGRQDLYYQYRHNSALTNRIDPGSTNIIDLYVVTQDYYTAYRNYIVDSTNTIPAPVPPTIDALSTEYAGLQNYKMISDNVIVNPVQFKPLFGAKAAEQLRATIKVIRASNSTASISEIKSNVVANLDAYFAIANWDFGDTFYFTELSTYVMTQLSPDISSFVIVPRLGGLGFGSLFEIKSASDQLFVSGATVNDIEIISGITATSIKSIAGTQQQTNVSDQQNITSANYGVNNG